MAVRSIAVGACKGFTKNQHPSRGAKKLSNFSLFLGCALPCYRNCFPCYFLSLSGQEIPKNRLRPGIRHDFPSRNRDFPVFFPVLAAETGFARRFWRRGTQGSLTGLGLQSSGLLRYWYSIACRQSDAWIFARRLSSLSSNRLRP